MLITKIFKFTQMVKASFSTFYNHPTKYRLKSLKGNYFGDSKKTQHVETNLTLNKPLNDKNEPVTIEQATSLTKPSDKADQIETIDWLEKLKSKAQLFQDSSVLSAFTNANADFSKLNNSEKINLLLDLIQKSEIYIPQVIIEKNIDDLETCQNMEHFKSIMK